MIYYYHERWLHGPIGRHEMRAMLDAGDLTQGAPTWTHLHDGWIPASLMAHVANQANSEDTALIEFDDPAAQASQAVVSQVEFSRLPSPRQLLMLRHAREQELITANQCERCLQTLLETPQTVTDLARWLSAHGWITSAQADLLSEAVKGDTGKEMIAGYEILAILGRGGMGTTYQARQVSMDRMVALKVLLPRFSQDAAYVRRFEREARMAARLNHENIATAYEVGAWAGHHYLAMEYVDGSSITELIREHGPFEEARALEVVLRIAHALQHAHEHHMVHRDLSSKNVLVRVDGTPKLIDMGLAKTVGGDTSVVSTEGVTVGTPAYMSPEQALGREDVDIRSDIYGLGCVLWEMLAGRPPLLGGSMMETLSKHINEEIPPIREIRKDVGALTEALIRRMSAKAPGDRFQTPQAVIEAITGSDETVAIQLPPTPAAVETPPVDQQLKTWQSGQPVEILLRPAWREYVHMVGMALERRLAEAECEPEFQGYVQTVYAELVANAFDHGCRDLDEATRAAGVIRVRMELNEAFFRLEVEDPGPGFAAREMLERIKAQPYSRERQRGIIQLLQIADLLEYSPSGNAVKAVLYRKSEGSGIFERESEGIHSIQIKGKGDLALAEQFRRWVERYEPTEPRRVLLMVRTDWVSSMFVGTIGKLAQRLKEGGSALSVWVEHIGCYRIMQQLGVTSFVRIHSNLEEAELDLRYANIKEPPPETAPGPASTSASPEGATPSDAGMTGEADEANGAVNASGAAMEHGNTAKPTAPDEGASASAHSDESASVPIVEPDPKPSGPREPGARGHGAPKRGGLSGWLRGFFGS